jgi:hypothetical protein
MFYELSIQQFNMLLFHLKEESKVLIKDHILNIIIKKIYVDFY